VATLLSTVVKDGAVDIENQTEDNVVSNEGKESGCELGQGSAQSPCGLDSERAIYIKP